MSPRLSIKVFILSIIVFLDPLDPYLSDPSLWIEFLDGIK